MKILDRLLRGSDVSEEGRRAPRRSGQQHLQNRRREERRQGPEDRRNSFRFDGVGDRRAGTGRRNTDTTADEDYWR